MMIIHCAPKATIAELLDWAEAQERARGTRVLRVVAYRGPDGLVRGSIVFA